MKIKNYSWILAGAYPLCGVVLFLVLFKMQTLFSGFGMEMPFATKITLAVGPFGWLVFSIGAGILVVLKDLRFRSRLLNPLLTFAFGFWISCIAFALFYPFVACIGCGLH